MILKQATTSASALPARPERPFKYVWPVATLDGSVGYDRPLENYFDASMAPRLLPPLPPSRLYDTTARAHDHQYHVTPDMVDPAWSNPRPLNPRERHRSLALVSGNSPDYMGISSDIPGWHPRRSSYEDRRGAVGVIPSEVNTLVPYIPPIDTSVPPPSREWLDAMAKRFLADAHADFEGSHCNATSSATSDAAPSTGTTEQPSVEEDDITFDYDTDSTLEGVMTVPRISMPQRTQQPPQMADESSSHDADYSDTDTDTDTNSDDGYDWNVPRSPPSGPGAQWLIPRKRPSVVIVNKNVAMNVDDSTDTSGSRPPYKHEQSGKRRRGERGRYPKRVTKTPKRHVNDTPARHYGESILAYPTTEGTRPSSRPPARPSPFASDTPTSSRPPVSSISSITATALQMKQVRITSPGIPSPLILPQPHTASSVPPRSPKLFPCMLDGCTQVCASAGDLQRHQQSLRHRAPSHNCLACGRSYTRPDALKRHLNSKASCKREHAAKLVNSAEAFEEGAPEASDGAVQSVVMYT